MKKIVIFAIFMVFSAFRVQAQLVVDSLGRVSIIPGTNGWKPTLQIGNNTLYGAGVNIKDVGRHYNLEIIRTLSDTTSVGIRVYSTNYQHWNTGIDSRALGIGAPNAVGIKGCAYYSHCNVGVLGLGYNYNFNSDNCAGIYGSPLSASPSFAYSGQYAGYFDGTVRVAYGPLYATVLSPTASSGNGSTQSVNVITYDRDGGETVTSKLNQVQTIQFIRDKREMEREDETIELFEEERAALAAEGVDVETMQKEKRVEKPTLSAIQYGLAADQLKEVYPELVYEDKEGNVSINYIEMIPLLVQSINELSSELAELKGTSNKKAKAKTTAIEDAADDMDQVRMDQNKPNPFGGSTVITLSVPKKAKQAAIYIYDLSGKQVESVPVEERGKTNITFYASNLSAGMYIYSLVVDGQVKVTRRMMVTE